MYDSQATFPKAYNEINNEKCSHMSLSYDYIRQLIKNGINSLNYIKSNEHLADHLIKPLNRDLIISTLSRIWLKVLN